MRLTSHIDFGIPTRSRLRHPDLNDVCVPPQNSPSRLLGRPRQFMCSGRPPSPSGRPPGAPGRPQLRSSYPLVDGPLPSTRTVSCCRRAPLVDRCSLLRSTGGSVDLPVEVPLLVDGPSVTQTSQLQLSSSLVDSNITAVPCSSTKTVEQLSHCGRSAATPVHPTKSSALPKRERGQHSTPVNIFPQLLVLP
ncbi:unnamed protein product [Closterium sp. NIES-53]